MLDFFPILSYYLPMEVTRLVNGAAVAAIREALGMKQVRLAQACGVSGAFISNIEAGRKQPGPQTLRAIADALGVELEAITYPALKRPPAPKVRATAA